MNLLARPSDSPELVVDQVVSIFHDLYRDSWGPRTDDILRAALLTLVGVPGMTLAEIPLLLTDPGFRRPLVGRINDPVALGPFWGWYDALSDGERTAAIGPVMNKLRTFLLRRRLRNILGQADPVFDFDQALAARSIVLVPLTKGLLGEESAALLGSLVVTRLWQAVQARASMPAGRAAGDVRLHRRVPGLPAPAGRGGDDAGPSPRPGLGLTLAHQHLGQLPASVREAVLANARSRVIFQVAASDAKTLARELTPHVTAADLQGLGRYEVVARLSVGGQTGPPGHRRPPCPRRLRRARRQPRGCGPACTTGWPAMRSRQRSRPATPAARAAPQAGDGGRHERESHQEGSALRIVTSRRVDCSCVHRRPEAGSPADSARD